MFGRPSDLNPIQVPIDRHPLKNTEPEPLFTLTEVRHRRHGRGHLCEGGETKLWAPMVGRW